MANPLLLFGLGQQGMGYLDKATGGDQPMRSPYADFVNPANPTNPADIEKRKKLAEYYKGTKKMVGKVGAPTGPILTAAMNTQQQGTGGVKPIPSSTATWADEPSMVPQSSGGYQSVLSSGTPRQPFTPRGPSESEQKNSANVSSLARLLGAQGSSLYNVSNPAYKQALDYYGQILSGDKGAVSQAIAPEAEMIAEMTGAEQKALGNSSLRGGARDTALAESGRQGAGAMARLIPEARKNAAAAGSQLALQGMGLGTQQQGIEGGLYNSLADRELQDRLGSQSLELQGQGLDLQAQQLKLSEALGMRGLDLQQMGLALNEKLGMRGLDLQKMMHLDNYSLQRELGHLGIQLDRDKVEILKKQLQMEIQRGKGQAIGDAGNLLIKAIPMVLDIFGKKGATDNSEGYTGGSYDSGD